MLVRNKSYFGRLFRALMLIIAIFALLISTTFAVFFGHSKIAHKRSADEIVFDFNVSNIENKVEAITKLMNKILLSSKFKKYVNSSMMPETLTINTIQLSNMIKK